MPSFKSKFYSIAVLLMASTFLLTACGEGWEKVAYGGFPYSNARTAGTGIAYVRANMLPTHGAILKAEQPENDIIIDKSMPKRDSVESEGVLKALDKAFNKALRK